MASVNEDRTHVVSRQRHRVWCQSTEIPVSHPRSPDNPPAIGGFGHAPPDHRTNSTCSTRCTVTPGNPNNTVVPLLKPVASLVCCLSNSRTWTSRTRGHGRGPGPGPSAQARRARPGTGRCPVKIEEPLYRQINPRERKSPLSGCRHSVPPQSQRDCESQPAHLHTG